jgi:hypothetical protein
MPLASTLLVLLNRGATCRSPSSSKDRAGHIHQAGLTRSPTSVAGLVPLLADREELAGRRMQQH